MDDIRTQKQTAHHDHLASIGILTAGIAHEINNPIGASLLSAETALAMLESCDVPPEVNECLQNIVRSMERCGQIVRNTLRFAQDATSERSFCDLNGIVRQARDLIRAAAERSSSTIRLDLHESLPRVFVNELEIELLLVNLFKNSLESRAGIVDIWVSTLFDNGQVAMVVKDNGPGMTAEQKQSVFKPFYTTRPDQGGSGLGLSIVHRIVKGHGGTIAIESEPQQGTTVRVSLPIRPVS